MGEHYGDFADVVRFISNNAKAISTSSPTCSVVITVPKTGSDSNVANNGARKRKLLVRIAPPSRRAIYQRSKAPVDPGTASNRTTPNRAYRDLLMEHNAAYVERAETLIEQLKGIIEALLAKRSTTQRLKAVETSLTDDAQTLIDRCKKHLAFADGNFRPFPNRDNPPPTSAANVRVSTESGHNPGSASVERRVTWFEPRIFRCFVDAVGAPDALLQGMSMLLEINPRRMSYPNSVDSAVEDEVVRRIRGRFVGEDFSWLPGISAYGAMLRTARLNHLRRHEFFAAYQLRTTRRDELSHVLTFSTKRKDELALALDIGERERDLWDITEWLPFSGVLDWDSLQWESRICPCCARLGYHTLLFQLPWVARCPWHGASLIRYCRRCTRALSTTSAITPLRCPCGNDHINLPEACRHRQKHLLDMSRWITAYLNWAAEARENDCLIHTPNFEVSNWDALGQLVEMPAALQARCGHARTNRPRMHERRISIYDHPNANPEALNPQFLLKIPVDVDGIVELPRAIWKAFRGVGYELAEKLPEATFSDGELLRFFAGSQRPAIRFAATHRPGTVDILFLPVQVGGERGFLYVNAMEKAARDVVHRLGTYLEKATGNSDVAVEVGLLVLLRAYAEGMRVILSRFVPALFEMKRDRPHLTVPWVLLHRKAGSTVAASIVWSPRGHNGQAALTPSTRKNRQRALAPRVRRRRRA